MSQSGLIGVPDKILPPDVPLIFVGNVGSGSAVAHIFDIVGAGGVSTSVVGNMMTITVSASGMTWSTISANQTLVVNNGYFLVSPGGTLSLLLPPVSNIGDEIEIALDGATGFTITQGAGQSIKFANSVTTSGVGGSLSSTQQGDSVRLVCRTANLRWMVLASDGNLTVV